MDGWWRVEFSTLRTDLMSLSQTPPRCDVAGGLKLHSIPSGSRTAWMWMCLTWSLLFFLVSLQLGRSSPADIGKWRKDRYLSSGKSAIFSLTFFPFERVLIWHEGCSFPLFTINIKIYLSLRYYATALAIQSENNEISCVPGVASSWGPRAENCGNALWCGRLGFLFFQLFFFPQLFSTFCVTVASQSMKKTKTCSCKYLASLYSICIFHVYIHCLAN